jgi:hypothetical protein
VGQDGAVYTRDSARWSRVDLGFVIDETLHSVWVAPGGDVWAVGGQVLTLPLVDGILLHEGAHIPAPP